MNEEITVQNKLFGKTFFWMFLGLLGSGIIAWYTYASGLFIDIIVGDYFNILLVLELVVVFAFSLLFKKMPPIVVGILYFVYSMINGVTLSVIFVAFELSSIIYLFGISALLINLFILKNDTFELILDWLILALFFGVTIYDINKIKLLQEEPSIDNDKIHIYCAMQLYLDFINIFLRILSIFGKRRN